MSFSVLLSLRIGRRVGRQQQTSPPSEARGRCSPADSDHRQRYTASSKFFEIADSMSVASIQPQSAISSVPVFDVVIGSGIGGLV